MDQVNECLMDVSEDCLTSALLSFRYPSVMRVKLHVNEFNVATDEEILQRGSKGFNRCCSIIVYNQY